MRRLVGLIALAILIFGAWWLVHNGYDMVRLTAGMTASEDASPAGESPQDVEAPSESGKSSAAPEASGPAAGDTAEALAAETPAAPDASAAAGPEAAPGASAPAAGAPEAGESTVSASDAATAGPAAGDVPTFDVVRVEPSGETVIAGLAAPNTTVEVVDGPETVAKAEANERGEWALVLEKPLSPGTHDLAIRTTSKDKSIVTLSDQRVAVAVPEDKSEEPLVVLNAPKAPSTVMQAPGTPPKETTIASAPSGDATKGPSSASEAPTTPSAPGTASSPEARPSEPSSPSAPATGAAPAEPRTAETPDASPAAPSSESEIAAAQSKEPSAASGPSADAGAETPAAPETMQPETGVASAEPSAPAGETPSSGSAATEPSAAAPSTASPETAGQAAPAAEKPAPPPPEVSVAAVEAETDGSLYIAGTASTKEPVRVYVDDELVGEAKPTEGGTWLLETKRDVAPGEYTIRADQVEQGSGKVIVRAEVPFEREVEVAVLKQSSESGDAVSAETSGQIAAPQTVIIKRGDNLWRISRSLYGRGIRYSTIYRANRDQIRNPNRIYPGQVLVMPAGDTTWQQN